MLNRSKQTGNSFLNCLLKLRQLLFLVVVPVERQGFFCLYLSTMNTILVTGGTGMIGSLLVKELSESGYEVIVASRSVRKSINGKVQVVQWDPSRRYIDPAILQKVHYIVNLAGAGIAAKRWNESYKKEIITSRIEAAQTIIENLQKVPHQVRAVINASAIGWYGPDVDYGMRAFFTEEASPANDFLGKACQEWENAIEPIRDMNIRLIKFRFGHVLSTRGGALVEYLNAMKKGVAPIMGNGKQTLSWIHELDLVRMIHFAIQNEQVDGVYNAVAPRPVTNKEFVHSMKLLYPRSTIGIHVPSFILSIVVGEMKEEVLKSVTVSSKKISDAGFQFIYPLIETALGHLIKTKKN